MCFDWDKTKNVVLQIERGISFEQIVGAIGNGMLLEVFAHTDRIKYPGQILMIVNIDGYACVVPTVKNGDVYFMKTAFKSRKYTKKYLTGGF
ncbi:MAG: BrnT family toxin [Chitinivibrionia bacterium]|nr:BrnT family toxin [Chitinivibrionia bacterium]